MFIIPSIDLSMKLSLSEVFVSNIIVTMVISNKSCCKHVLFTNLSDFISTTTRVTSLKSKKFLFCSFSVAKFGIAPFFTSLYPSSEGSMRSTLLHPPIIPHYDHITSVIHTVTHLLDPLLQPSFILLYPCNTQKLKLLLLKEPNGHYKGTLLPSVNTNFLNQKCCLYFLSELSVLSIIGLELETNGIIHCA